MSSKRALIWLKQRFIGDAVLSTSLIDWVAQSRDTHVLVPPHLEELLRLQGPTMLPAGKRSGFKAMLDQGKRLQAMNFDEVYLVNRSARCAIIAALAKIPRRIGHGTEGRGPLLTDTLRYDEKQFERESYLDLGKAADLPGSPSGVRLALNADERHEGRALLEGATIAIHPGSALDWKRLPMAELTKAAEWFHRRGNKVVLVGGASERAEADALIATVKFEMTDLVGKCSLRQSMAALAEADFLLSGDTGLAHLAAAFVTPGLAIFGPSQIEKWGYNTPTNRSFQVPTKRCADFQFEAIRPILEELLSQPRSH